MDLEEGNMLQAQQVSLVTHTPVTYDLARTPAASVCQAQQQDVGAYSGAILETAAISRSKQQLQRNRGQQQSPGWVDVRPHPAAVPDAALVKTQPQRSLPLCLFITQLFHQAAVAVATFCSCRSGRTDGVLFIEQQEQLQLLAELSCSSI
jgi:hypothetical protein